MSTRPIPVRFAVAAAASIAATACFAQGTGPLLLEQGVSVTETRLDVGLPGASTSVITADDIARSPAKSLPEILATQAGVQSRDLYGGTGGAQGTVDIRGFGATASSNTLILIDGRRVNPFDQGALDFARVPLADIERVEITRGSAAAVLYGDGAVGGVVNIVTKSATRQADGGALGGGIGSLGTRQGDGSLRRSVGPLDLSAFGTFLKSDGFRENNKLVERNLFTEARHRGEAGDVFANIHLASQGLGLPGARRVTLTSNQLISDPEGAQTPFNRSKQDDDALTIGGTRRFGADLEALVDGGIWRRAQEAQYVDTGSFVDTDLTTWSLTPRVKRQGPVLGLAGNLVAGIDLYYYDYGSDRAGAFQATPIHRYSANQTNAAAYGQQTLALDDATDLTAGVRLQRAWVNAHDVFDPNAPGAFGAQLAPLSESETNWAADIGLNRRLTPEVSLFGRVGRAFRFPNVDDRIGASPFGATTPNFELATQTSWDAEVGGRYERGRFSVQLSAYLMKLRDEIAFDAVNFINVNLDPTRRRGAELQATAGLLSNLRARAAVAVTDARFESGPNRGKVVPLVAPYTASGTLEWDVTRDIAVTGVVTYVSAKRLDNDASNFQPQIPDYALVDLRVNGKLFEHVTWSAQADNLFDTSYFNYGVASTATFGTYNAYPLPGRTFLFRLGAVF
jgi:iron complex outermembrane receptor protein